MPPTTLRSIDPDPGYGDAPLAGRGGGAPLWMICMPFHMGPYERYYRRRGFIDRDHAMHCLLTECFGDKVLRPFRLIAGRTRDMGSLYGYAHEDGEAMREQALLLADPLHAPVFELDEPFPTRKLEHLDRQPPGKVVGFEVRIRPTVRRPYRETRDPRYRATHEHDAYYTYLRDHYPADYRPTTVRDVRRVRHRAYGTWLFRHLRDQGSCELVPYTFHITRYANVAVVRKHGQKPRRGPDVVCRGTLRIKDPSTFKDLIKQGIGRHRAYGYGMVLLKQVHEPRYPQHVVRALDAGDDLPTEFPYA